MQNWLRAHPPVALGADNERLTKAGLLPIEKTQSGWRVFVMKPPAEKPELGAPEFQIAKGTRMFRHDKHWEDCRKAIPEHYDELELLAMTALREAEEEIGLKHKHIETWYNIGEVEFLSATKQNKKSMQLYAAFLNSPLADTHAARWLTLEEAQTLMRKDHFAIVEKVVAMLP